MKSTKKIYKKINKRKYKKFMWFGNSYVHGQSREVTMVKKEYKEERKSSKKNKQTLEPNTHKRDDGGTTPTLVSLFSKSFSCSSLFLP